MDRHPTVREWLKLEAMQNEVGSAELVWAHAYRTPPQ
jgi:hypothetical protein